VVNKLVFVALIDNMVFNIKAARKKVKNNIIVDSKLNNL
jgi:hypothetical protein